MVCRLYIGQRLYPKVLVNSNVSDCKIISNLRPTIGLEIQKPRMSSQPESELMMSSDERRNQTNKRTRTRLSCFNVKTKIL